MDGNPDSQNLESSDHFDSQKKQLEIEILRVEKEKLEAERDEIIKRSRAKWYHNEKLIQFLLASLLTIPIFWFFFDSLVKPLYLKENELNKQENALNKIETEINKVQLEQQEIKIKNKEEEAKQLQNEAELSKKQSFLLADSVQKQVRKNDSMELVLKDKIVQNENYELSLNQRTKEIQYLRDTVIRYGERIALKEQENDSLRNAASEQQQISDQQYQEQKKLLAKIDNLIQEMSSAASPEFASLVEEWDLLYSPISNINLESSAYITGIRNYLLVGDGVEYIPTPKNTKKFEPGALKFAILNFTAAKDAKTTALYLAKDDVKASDHIIIGKDGRIYQLVPFNTVAWHAGMSSWKNYDYMNNYSIGIDFSNVGRLERKGNKYFSYLGFEVPENMVYFDSDEGTYWEKFTDEQLVAAKRICKLLIETYNLEEILGHSEISPKRKVDPGPAFPLEDFRVAKLISE